MRVPAVHDAHVWNGSWIRGSMVSRFQESQVVSREWTESNFLFPPLRQQRTTNAQTSWGTWGSSRRVRKGNWADGNNVELIRDADSNACEAFLDFVQLWFPGPEVFSPHFFNLIQLQVFFSKVWTNSTCNHYPKSFGTLRKVWPKYTFQPLFNRIQHKNKMFTV